LTGYIAIVNGQEIPIGGIKAVGTFEPGGVRYESPLSKWFFEGYSAPGPVIKTSSVKFEPPGGIQDGVWFIHLEDEWGTRLSEDVTVTTSSNNPEWFFIKFKQPGPPGGRNATPTPYWGGATPTPHGMPTTTPGPTPTIAPTATGAAPAGGWSFDHVHIVAYPDDEMVVVYADMVNNTGSSQQISYVTGTMFDEQGQAIPQGYDTYDYWLIEVVPPGGRAPVELSVYGVQDVGSASLSVVSQPSGETPRQDFEFSDLNATDDPGVYCVSGRLHNRGDKLNDYVMVAAILYNDQDQIIDFDGDTSYSPQDIVGDTTYDFEFCIDVLDQNVGRYEMRAWGK
jgi:hypothetical protein